MLQDLLAAFQSNLEHASLSSSLAEAPASAQSFQTVLWQVYQEIQSQRPESLCFSESEKLKTLQQQIQAQTQTIESLQKQWSIYHEMIFQSKIRTPENQ